MVQPFFPELDVPLIHGFDDAVSEDSENVARVQYDLCALIGRGWKHPERKAARLEAQQWLGIGALLGEGWAREQDQGDARQSKAFHGDLLLDRGALILRDGTAAYTIRIDFH